MGHDPKAVCRLCTCEIRAHHEDLVRHASTDNHKKTRSTVVVNEVYGHWSLKTRQAEGFTEIITRPVCHNATSLLSFLFIH